MCGFWETAAQVGEALSGIATGAAVIVALYVGHRWRRDRLAERRGDAAARALESAVRACSMMRGWCEMLCTNPETDAAIEEGHSFETLFRGIDAKITDNVLHGLYEAQVSAVALLDEAAGLQKDGTRPLQKLSPRGPHRRDLSYLPLFSVRCPAF